MTPAATADNRRRRWIAVSDELLVSRTGTRLLDAFGLSGIGMWVAYLCACKRAPVEGTLSYHSETDALAQLGLVKHPPPFGVETFFTLTGRMKQTVRTRRGRITDTRCTQWERWQKTISDPKNSWKTEGYIRNLEDGNTSARVQDKTGTKQDMTEEHARALVQLLSPVGELTLKKAATIVRGYPDRDHLAEAAKMVNWTLDKGVQRRDVGRAFANWLDKAGPRRASGEADYPVGAPGERA